MITAQAYVGDGLVYRKHYFREAMPAGISLANACEMIRLDALAQCCLSGHERDSVRVVLTRGLR